MTCRGARESLSVPVLRVAPFFAACMAFVFLSACGREKPAPAPAPTVGFVEVVQRDVPVYTEWVATTDGFVNATIRAQVQGYLWQRNYQEGNYVKKGQLLFEIDPRPFEAALDQAKAALKQAEAARDQAKAEVIRNEAQHFITEADLNRIKPLAEEKAESQRNLDDATGAERSAQAAVVSARAAVSVAEAAVTAGRAAVERAGLDLGFTRITSPIDGIAGLATAQVGDLVGPAQTGTLTAVSTVDPIKVYFSISEQDYLDHRQQYSTGADPPGPGTEMEHELVLADGSIYPQKGKFYAIDRQVDLQTGTIRIVLLFPNPDNLLRPGQFGRVRTASVKPGALLVPQRAVAELQGIRQVAVVGTDNRVEIRPVTAGERAGTLWIIEKGLQPGERVVAEGAQKVKQGMTVNPTLVTGETSHRRGPLLRLRRLPTQRRNSSHVAVLYQPAHRGDRDRNHHGDRRADFDGAPARGPLPQYCSSRDPGSGHLCRG